MKDKNLEIRMIKNRQELNEVLKIREIVFVKGQNCPWECEMDGLDEEAEHIIVKYCGKTIGCARIRFLENRAKLERVALLKEYRGRGFGKEMMKYLIKHCKRRKVEEIFLHSQLYVKDFYKKFGFKPRGKTFMEAGIEHIEMYMKCPLN
ncbi:MAG TPA: GNAT family N-acetyltransferase [Candidatus Aerophobetes bacterium]|nr:GNAT family N-acetyltransferase [Candidatus Aerophobetes bacterium]